MNYRVFQDAVGSRFRVPVPRFEVTRGFSTPSFLENDARLHPGATANGERRTGTVEPRAFSQRSRVLQRCEKRARDRRDRSLYYTVPDGNGQATTAREAGDDVGGDAGFNLGLLMRQLIGVGTLRRLQGSSHKAGGDGRVDAGCGGIPAAMANAMASGSATRPTVTPATASDMKLCPQPLNLQVRGTATKLLILL